MMISIPVNKEHLKALVGMANVSYWAIEHDYILDGDKPIGVRIVEVLDDETGITKTHELTFDQIAQGLVAMSQKAPRRFDEFWDERSWDNVLGDILVQFACFGDIKYC